jgi:predicted SnoaL-like aldol condensation-catalyzing enzyme
MTRKEIAIHFLQLCAPGRSEEAFALYVAPHFIHHNAYFEGDGHSLMSAMKDYASPTKVFNVLRALEDRDLVAIHSHVRPKLDDLGAVVMHIFRFEGDKIVELWDFGQAIPEDLVNQNGML